MLRFMSVDDDDIFNFLNQRILELSSTLGKIDAFNSGSKALAWLNDHLNDPSQWPQIILLDIRMPGMDGFEFLEEFEKLPENLVKKVKVFMLTSSIDERDRKKSATYASVHGYYSKPLTPEKFQEIIEQAGIS